jgi:2-oxoglutarate dehydrogenase E2 component (dihydrolipoamide succinyltransferase)
MAHSVEMPALGESVTEGTVTRWLKQVGEPVEVDEPLLEVSTDKVDTEIPSPVAGIVLDITVAEDETVEVGVQLALIGDESENSGRAGGSDKTPAQEYAAAAPEPEPDRAEPEPDRAEPAATGGADRSSDSDGSGGAGGTPVTMPALGESVTEGTVIRWLKQVGEPVEVDEPLLEVSTDKVDTEIPSPVAGTVLEISVGEDETVEVGARLAVVGSGSTGGGEQPENQPAPESQPEPQSEPQSEPEPEPEPEVQRKPEPERVPQQAGSDGSQPAAPYVTPLVRKLATEHDVNLSTVQGTGVGGRIRKQDVLAAVEQQAPEPEPARSEAPAGSARQQQQPAAAPSALRGRTEKMSRLRKVIAKRMVESLQVSAQLTTVVEVDVTRIARLRDSAKRDFAAREGVKLSFLPFFAKATVEALKNHVNVNASIDQDAGEITYHGAEHLGIAVDTEHGLVVPVIHDAGDLNIAGLARRIDDVAKRTRTNKITPDELAGGTFTLSNTGSRGALFDTPIVNQPQVGILGTGTVVKRAVVVTGEEGDGIAVRSMMYLALSYDHRLVDGADAARFLSTVKQRLEEGAFEADLGL